MIVDIRYTDAPPEQIQGVRMVTCYPRMEAKARPEFVIHFVDYKQPIRYVDQWNVFTLTLTND